MKMSRLVLALVLTALPLQTGIAGAADAGDAMPNSMASVDCSTAKDQMMKMMAEPAKMPMMDSSATLDKSFAMGSHEMTGHMMKIVKLEAVCGKDAKTKALAKKMLGDLEDYTTKVMTIQRNLI